MSLSVSSSVPSAPRSAATEPRIALVTGANKGIGLQIVKELAKHGFVVWLGSRDRARGETAAQGIEGDVRAVELDVTKPASIAAAAEHIRASSGQLDVLVNNAGIAPRPCAPDGTPLPVEGRTPSRFPLALVRETFETNVFGVIAVTQAMLPLLRESPAARIINLSSGLGSLTRISEPAFPYPGVGGVAYGPSKTALNAVTVAFAQELASFGVKVNAVCPGFTATDLNGHTGPRTVVEAAREPVRLALLGAAGPTGTLSDENGPLPW